MKDCAIPSEQIVSVPVRDQDHYENVTSGHQDSSADEAPVSIHDIVRRSGPYTVQRSSSNQSPPPYTNAPGNGINIAVAKARQNSQADFPVEHSTSQFAEVLVCGNRDTRIRAIRENWDKIRQGSLSFSSFPVCKPGLGYLSSGTSSELNSSSSSNIKPDHTTQNIKKAWKMMNSAKTIEKKKKTNNVPYSSNGSKRTLSDMRTPKQPSSVRSTPLSSYNSGDKGQDFKKFKRPYQDCDAEKRNDTRKLHVYRKENATIVPNFEGHPATYSIESSKFSTSKIVQYSVRDRIDHGNFVSFPPNNSLGTFSNNANKNHDFSTCGSAGPVARVHLSSTCNNNEVTNVEKHYADGEAKVDTDAKSEIQSLVKCNLKLSSTKKKLDTNEFKEVARLATHSILAACGIGQPKSWVRHFPSPKCTHVEVEQIRRSTLLPSSCRECFLVFVKDVVNTILLE